MKRVLVSLAVALFALHGNPSQAADVKCNTIANGMLVCVYSNHNVPMIAHHLTYKVGSIDEADSQYGMAHLLEHLLFKKTSNGTDYKKTIAEIGGYFNAFTTQNATAFYVTAPKEYIETIMRAEADRMQNTIINKETTETEKLVVLEERNMRLVSDDLHKAVEDVTHTLYRDHRYAHSVIGWDQSIRSITAEELKKFYMTYYNPCNAILTVAGDITYEEGLRLAKKHYGTIENIYKPPQRREPLKAKMHGRAAITVQNERISQDKIIRLYPVYHENPNDMILTIILADLLGSGNTSKLHKYLVEDKKAADQAVVSYHAIDQHVGRFFLILIPGQEVNNEALLDILNEFIEEITKSGLSDKDLARAKSRAKADRIYKEENMTGIAEEINSALSRNFTVQDINSIYDMIEKIDRKTINKKLKEILLSDHFVDGLVIPAK